MADQRPDPGTQDAAHAGPAPPPGHGLQDNAQLTAATNVGAQGDAVAGLFGRGMLYVAVWSLQLLSAVFVSPVLAHLLPPGQFGQLASAISLHQVLVVVATAGFDQAVILFRARAGTDRAAQGVIALGLGIAAVTTLVAGATAPLWSAQLGFAGAAGIVVLTIGWTLPAVGASLCGALLLSQDRLKPFTVVNMLAGVGGQAIGLTILVASGSRTASTYAWGNLTALVLATVCGAVLVRPRWKGLAEPALARRALRLGGPLMITNLAVFVLNAGDRLIIQRLLGPSEVGRYQVAYTVGNVAIIVLLLMTSAWAAQVAAVRDDSARWALLGTARDRLYGLLTPVLLGLTLGAPVALMIVSPRSYSPGGLLTVVFFVAVACFPVNAGTATGRALLTLERSKALAVAAVVSAVVNVGLNLALVRVWGLVGSATATLVAFSVQAVMHRLYLPRWVAWPRTSRKVLLECAAAVAVCAGSLLLPQDTAWNIIRLTAAAACLPWLVRRVRLARAGAPKPAGGATGDGSRGRGRGR